MLSNTLHTSHTPPTHSRFPLLLIPIIIAISVLLVLFSLYLLYPMESYFAPYPAIGTTFTEGYNEADFQRIQVGMSSADVENLLGKPLHVLPMVEAGQLWEYSQDGGMFGDFAWLYRGISFDSEGRVMQVSSAVHYD